MEHAVIMAGGSGTRLWPLSRRARPKQFMRLFEGASLLQLARRRLAGIFAAEQIWVITGADYLDLVASELPDLPPENLIGEPVGRDTANAIGLAANILALRDPAATMAIFTADHLITPQEPFAAALRAGLATAAQSPVSLVTFGITPDAPHTGYGYIRRGAAVGPGVYRVEEFKEKPTRAVAEGYLASGEYYWNSGMFAWRVGTILDELRRQLPQNAAVLAEVATHWRCGALPSAAATAFAGLERKSIDFGVMEHAPDVLAVEMPCRWLDLGSWVAIGQTRTPDAAGNAVIAPRAIVQDARGNVLVSEDEHLIACLGLSDVVVVHSPDATLICHRDAIQSIRDVVDECGRKYGTQYE